MASAPDWTPLPHMISPMTEVEGRSALSPEVGTTRVEAFSDSVMAVIITIMAFELRRPQGAGLDAMRDQLPGVLVYMLSFVFVAIYWNNHHHLLRAADRISGSAMWANMFLLFWLSLIPVVTGVDSRPIPAPAARRGLRHRGPGGRVRLHPAGPSADTRERTA